MSTCLSSISRRSFRGRTTPPIIDKHGAVVYSFTGGVTVIDRIVGAVGEHVVAKQTIACGSILVRVDKPGNHRVIITALQIVEACFGIVIIPAIPQRIDVRQAAAGGNELAPGVVLIGGQYIAVDILNAGDVALLGGHVVAGHIGAAGRVIPEANRRTFVVIEEEKLVAVPLLPNQLIAGVGVMVSNTIHCLGGPQAVAVIGIGNVCLIGVSFH